MLPGGTFSVNVPSDALIEDLKEKVREKEPTVHRHVDATAHCAEMHCAETDCLDWASAAYVYGYARNFTKHYAVRAVKYGPYFLNL